MQLEGEATARAIKLAGFVNTPLYVVHVMSIDAMEEISKARKSGSLCFTFLALLVNLLVSRTMFFLFSIGDYLVFDN